MFRLSTFQKIFVGALLAVVMAGGDALAQRGEGRGRGGGGGGDGGSRSSSSRSFSGGGGGGGGSSRSFSGGGGSSRSSRSFSGGGESRSSRSFSGGGESSRSSRSSRSFSSSPRSSGSESGSSFRSFSGDSRSSRQLSRPSDSGSSRSFSNQSRSGQERSFDGGQRSAERSVIGQSDRGTFSGQQGDRTARSFDRGSQGRSGQQQYEARRPNASEGEVRDFLGLPSDGTRQARSGDRSGQLRSSDDSQRRADVARRLEGMSRDGDRVRDGENVFGRTGDRDGRDGDRSRDITRDRDFDRNRDFDRERDFNRDGDRDFARRDGERGRDGRDGDRDRDYASWRGGADRDHDNRDWSGRWRDGDRFDDARRIRKDWRDRDWGDWNKYPFYAGWWGGHHRWHGGHGHDWNWWGSYARRYNNPFYWWAWTTAPRLTSWVNFGWNRPYYWDYGPGEYIYCDDGIVYVNGRWYQPAPVFYDRTVQIVERAPDLTPDEAAELEWLPLGVFAVTPDGEAQANVLVQLAMTKDGVISGTAFDQKGGSASPIEGTVDRETQRAVWSYNNSENKRIVMETSIYNLTQPEATGLVHYGPDDFRVVELVRLEEPNATSGTTSATGELPAP